MRGPTWLRVTPKGKAEALVQVELKSARQVLSFAWDMAKQLEVALWVRPIVFLYLIFAALRTRAAE